MRRLNKLLLITVISMSTVYGTSQNSQQSQVPQTHSVENEGGTYRLVVDGFDWGAAVSKVILSLGVPVSGVNASDYKVYVERRSDCVEIEGEEASGERTIVHAYVSDDQGQLMENGSYITLVLYVSPILPLGSALKYVRNDKCSGNSWVDYQVTVTDKTGGRVWNTETGRISGLLDRFDLSGRYPLNEKQTMSYACFSPPGKQGKSPLIIWLHGGGEGGNDPSVPLMANRAANYAADDIQAIFKGAYVLVPQCPGAWMHNAQGVMTHGGEDDVYHEGLMKFIQNFVTDHPDIDSDRIYVGGCSNGGYMSLKLILEHPDYFAAGFISSLAYQSKHISDDKIESIKEVPIWFVHSADDRTTIPEETVIPVYKRLINAGAKNVHLSYYDHVVDITGFFGGADFHYEGHWSWIYCHANLCRWDYDELPVEVGGRTVTIMEWLALQAK